MSGCRNSSTEHLFLIFILFCDLQPDGVELLLPGAPGCPEVVCFGVFDKKSGMFLCFPKWRSCCRFFALHGGQWCSDWCVLGCSAVDRISTFLAFAKEARASVSRALTAATNGKGAMVQLHTARCCANLSRTTVKRVCCFDAEGPEMLTDSRHQSLLVRTCLKQTCQ